MSSHDSESSTVAALLQAHREANEEIRLHIARGDRVIGFALLVFGAGLAFGLAQNPPIREIFALIPVASFSAVWLFLDANAVVLYLGGYARFIEEEVNRVTGSPAVNWQRVAHRTVHIPGNKIGPIAFFGEMLLVGGVVAISLSRAWLTFERPYFWALAAGVGVGAILTGYALVSMTRAFERGYSTARSLAMMDSPPATLTP